MKIYLKIELPVFLIALMIHPIYLTTLMKILNLLVYQNFSHY